MALPDAVRARAAKQLAEFCESRVPAHVRHQVRLEHEFRGNTATLVERRVPWRAESKGEPWTESPIAQFRYDTATEFWNLFWPDRNSRWHADENLPRAADLGALLDEVDRDPTGIYWG